MTSEQKEGWADIMARQREKAEMMEQGQQLSPEEEEEMVKFQSKLTIQPIVQTELLVEIRNLLIKLTNEMKMANNVVIDGYKFDPVEPRVLYDPENVTIVKTGNDDLGVPEVVNKSSSPDDEEEEMTIVDEDDIVAYYKEKLKDYEFGGSRYFSDEDLDKFQFGIEEDKVVMKPIWLTEGFGQFLKFVRDELGGEYQQGKGVYHLPRP